MNRGIAALASAVTLCGCGGAYRVSGYDRAPDAPRGTTAHGRLRLAWSKRLVPEYEGAYLPIERAVPTLDAMHDRLFVGSSAGALWAFSGVGTALWSYQAGGGIGSQALLDAERDELYVASDDGLLHALRATTGESRWRAEVGGAVGRAPVATDDAVYLVTDSDVVIAFDRQNGEALWRYRREAAEGFYVTEHAGIALDGAQLITGFTDGMVAALDPRDGSVLWQRDTTADLESSSATIRFTDVDTTPLIDGETIFVASFAGGLYALERRSGSVKWLRSELTGVIGMARAAGDLLILSSGDLGVVAVRQRDGEKVWSHSIARGAPTRPTVIGDLVVVGESEGGVVALSLGEGNELERIENGHGFAAPVEQQFGRAAVVSNAGALFVFQAR